MKYFSIFLGFSLVFLLSCKQFSTVDSDDIVLEYGENILSLDDVFNSMPKGLSEADSLKWSNDFSNQWLRNQIIIAKAEKNLPKSQLNIDIEVLQYKSDLLKYKYENYYLRNKINTQVSTNEIDAFYKENKSALISTKTLVKATYVAVSNSIKDRYKVKQWLVSKREKDQEKLKVYAFKNAKVFDDFEEEWIELNSLKLLSHSKLLKENKSILNKVIEQKNDNITHYILVKEMIQVGQIMPLEYAKDEIVKIIVNRRKNKLLEEFSLKIDQELKHQLNKK